MLHHTPTPIEFWRWRIIWLLFLATMLNYMDRLALNNSSPEILAEFVPDQPGFGFVSGGAGEAIQTAKIARERNQLYARIQFAYGISFALFQIPAGFLIDRFSLRWLYLGAVLIWSGAGVATGFVPAGAIGAMIICRIVLGFGEAFNWPCAVAAVRRVVPRESRSLANGIFHSGASIGAVLTPLLIILIAGEEGLGWRRVFIVIGLAGAAWAILWILVNRGSRAVVIDSVVSREQAELGDEGSVLSAMRGRRFWICLLTGASVNICWHFYTQWFPRYLTEDAGVDMQKRQWILAGFFIAADLGSMTAGFFTRRLVRRGSSVEGSRMRMMTILAVIVLSGSIPAAGIGGAKLSLVFFYIVAAAAMGGFTIFFSLAQDVAPRHTAQILGICGAASWLLISEVTRVVGDVAGPGRYAELFIIVGAVPLLGAIGGWLWPRGDDKVTR